MEIELIRSYEIAGHIKTSPRFLVDRMWPRGLKKEDLELDLWIKELSPSDELRKWYHQDSIKGEVDSGKWTTFRKRYFEELNRKKSELGTFVNLIKGHKKITLIYSSREKEGNNAVVLKEYLLNLLK
jgi:uncharacterized protein YeaO (DUF488 family)